MNIEIIIAIVLGMFFAGLLGYAVIRLYKNVSRSRDDLRQHIDRSLRKNLDAFAKSYSHHKDLYQRVKDLEARISKHDTTIYKQIEAYIKLRDIVGKDILAKAEPLRGYALSPDALLALVRYVQQAKPKNIVEFGSGVSTMVLTSVAASYGGKVTSFDNEELFASKTRKTLMGADNITVLTRPLTKQKFGKRTYSWYSVMDEDLPTTVDLVIVDGPPESVQDEVRYPALPRLVGRMPKGSRLYLDDSNRKAETNIVNKWLKQFPDFELVNVDTEKGLAVLTRN